MREQTTKVAGEVQLSPSRPAAAWVCVAVFLAAAGLNLPWLGHAPLADSTEARHAEIGREFIAYGHWLVPTLDGRPHLTKPPLTDWLVAAGIKVFARNEFGARFGNALAAALGVALVAGFGLRLGGKRTALAAAAFYAVCPLYLGLSRTISIDILLAALATGAYWAAWELARETCRHPRRIAVAWAFCLGLGVLAKGHIILLVVLAPTVLWIILERQRTLAKRLAWPPAIALFLVMSLPWYVYIAETFPGWLALTLTNEFKRRIVGHEYGASYVGQSVLFLLGGALPAVPLAALAWRDCFRKPRCSDHGDLMLLSLWAIVPLVVFSIPKCQRVNYVAPLAPPLAMLAAMGWNRLAGGCFGGNRCQRIAAYLTAAIPALGGIGSFVAFIVFSGGVAGMDKSDAAAMMVGAAGAALAAALCVHYLLCGRVRQAEVMFALSAGFLWALSLPLLDAAKAPRSSHLMCEWINKNLPPDSKVGLYRYYMPSCNFYLGRYVELFKGTIPDDEWQGIWPTPELASRGAGSWKDLERLARMDGGIWLVVKESWLHDVEVFASARGLSLDTKEFASQWVLVHVDPRLLAGTDSTDSAL